MGLVEESRGILGIPTSIGGLMMEMMMFIMPIWTAFLVGLVLGWAWRPSRWRSLNKNKFDSLMSKISDFSIPSSPSKGFPSIQSLTAFNMKFSSGKGPAVEEIRADDKGSFSFQPTSGDTRPSCSSSGLKGEEHPIVNGDDLVHLWRLVEVKNGGPSWIQIMDRTTPTMSYKAWRRDLRPRRVDLYYSSWCIRPVESKRGTGQMTACEVLLFHYEDMGIPWEMAKLGVRQGMWGAVKKIDPGLREYLKARTVGGPLSGPASMALVTSKVSPQQLRSLLSDDDQSVTEVAVPEDKKQDGMNIPKLLVFGGLLTKVVIFGVARKLGRKDGGKL